MHRDHARRVAFEVCNVAIRSKRESRTRRDRPQQCHPSSRFVVETISISVNVSRLGSTLPVALVEQTNFSPTRCVVLSNHCLRRPVRFHAKCFHPYSRVIADRIRLERLLIIVRARDLDLVFPCPVETNELLRLCVIGLQFRVGDRPIARLAFYIPFQVVLNIGPTFVECSQSQIPLAEPQRHASVMLCATADTLTGITLDRRIVGAVVALINVRLVV